MVWWRGGSARGEGLSSPDGGPFLRAGRGGGVNEVALRDTEEDDVGRIFAVWTVTFDRGGGRGGGGILAVVNIRGVGGSFLRGGDNNFIPG